MLLGKHDGRSAKKLLHSIQLAIKQILVETLDKANFFCVLTDGSQARKTGDDKELVMTRVMKGGTYSNEILNDLPNFLLTLPARNVILTFSNVTTT